MRFTSSYTLVLLLIGSFWVQHSQSVGPCGNGVINSPEECDDGNTVSGDGCDSSCLAQPYYRCDTSNPNICKIDSKISISLLSNHRVTSSNTVILIFGFNYQFPVFNNINFQTIFSTTIPKSKISMKYNYDMDILTATLDYTTNIENTPHSFQLMLASTPYFWYDSQLMTKEVHGVNCQLTFQEDLWMHNIMLYVIIALVVITFAIVTVSIFFEKWIGLELIQTYQFIYYLPLLMKEYPFEFSAMNEGLRYANGFDDIIHPDYDRTYTLSNELNALAIEKEFPINFNVGMGLLGFNAIILVVLALRKARLKYRQQSEISRQLKKSLQRINKYFTFMFGEVFIMLVLVLMFKIFVVFIVQLSSKSSSINLFSDDTNIVLSLISFLILFTIIIYIFNWYIMIPDNLTENQTHLSLRFRNMKFSYPIIYLIYQVLSISAVIIYFPYDSSIYAIFSLQIVYFVFLIFFWPYNTARKINRILHNCTILYNQFIPIFLSIVIIRWRLLAPAQAHNNSHLQLKIYAFIIISLMFVAAILAVMRLVIFNKDVQCLQDMQANASDVNAQELKTFQKEDLGKIILRERIESGKESLLEKSAWPQGQQPINNELVGRFLNDKYINWSKGTTEEIKQSKSTVRMKNIKRTNTKQAELIKTPLQEFIQLKNNHKAMTAGTIDN